MGRREPTEQIFSISNNFAGRLFVQWLRWKMEKQGSRYCLVAKGRTPKTRGARRKHRWGLPLRESKRLGLYVKERPGLIRARYLRKRQADEQRQELH